MSCSSSLPPSPAIIGRRRVSVMLWWEFLIFVVVVTVTFLLSSSTTAGPSTCNAFVATTTTTRHHLHQSKRSKFHATDTAAETTTNDQKWLQNYNNLKEFHKEHGHCIVPSGKSKLGTWVSLQRFIFKQNEMRQDRVDLLNELDFTWILNDFQWRQKYESLIKFRNEHGHCNVPVGESKLGAWVATQRFKFKQNKLRQDRKELLDEIGFHWKRRKGFKKGSIFPKNEKHWLGQYELLKHYRNKYGDCNVPREWPESSLGHWVKTQRHDFAKNRMRQDRKILLDKIGLDWKPPKSNYKQVYPNLDKKWLENYEKVKLYYAQYGNFPSTGGDENSYTLARWIARQRELKYRNRLRKDRKDMLDKIDLNWRNKPKYSHNKEKQWMTQYQNLVTYYQEHGHCYIPPTTSKSLSTLRAWVYHQRGLYRKNMIKQSRKDLLDKIKFPWDNKFSKKR